MDDKQRRRAIEVITSKCAAILSAAPLDSNELAQRLHDESVFAPWIDLEPELPELDLRTETGRANFVDDVLYDRAPFMYSHDDLKWYDGLSVLEGRMLTHRLTQREVEGDFIIVDDALAFLDYGIEGDRADFGDLTVEVALDRATATDCWQGPDGWLSEFTADSLCLITRGASSFALTAIDDDELGDASLERTLIHRWLDDLEPGFSYEAWLLAYDTFLRDAGAFTSPVPPFPELMTEAGFEYRGGSYGKAGDDWRPSFVPAVSGDRTGNLAELFSLDVCCELELDQVIAAYSTYVEQPDDHDLDFIEIAGSLAHTVVAEAFEYWVGDLDQGGRYFAFLDNVADCQRPTSAAGHYLIGRHQVIQQGNTLDGVESYKRAVQSDPGYGLAQFALAEIEFYEGSFDASLRRLRSAGFDADEASSMTPTPEAPRYEAGRNEPCPCGSGRKFKACHNGKSNTSDLPVRARLNAKVQRFTATEEQVERVRPTLKLIFGDGPLGPAQMPYLEFALALALHEGGLRVDFLQRYGVLLETDEFELAKRQSETVRDLYEVVSVDPGESIELRSVRSGEVSNITERMGSRDARPGQYLLGRLVDGSPEGLGEPGRTQVFDADPLAVEMASRDVVLEALDEADPVVTMTKLAIWYGSMLMGPRVALSEAMVDHLGAGEAAELLDTLEQLERGEITTADLDIDEAYVPPELGSPEAQALERVILEHEAAWITEQIPALAHMTPVDAAADPTRREDLIRLLDTFPQSDTPFEMSAIRLRRMLNL
jgi:hypothetical protein